MLCFYCFQNSHRTEPQVKDKHGRIVNPFPEVRDILADLSAAGVVLGVASRTTEVKGARKLIETLGWDKYLTHKEIYPGCKITHFENLKKCTQFRYSEMLFFDDEERNIRDLTSIGVVSILVDDRGVNRKSLRDGLLRFAKERGNKPETQ